MRTRSTLVLLAAVAALGAYIYFVESQGPTTTDLEQRKDNVFREFDRERVDRITLTQKGRTIEAVKRDGKWRLVRPVETGADESAVDSVLSALEFLSKVRTIDAPNARKKSEFGLQSPRVRGSFRIAGRREQRFVVGALDATNEGIYLAVGDEPTVFVVPKDFFDNVSKDASELRDKRVAELRLSKIKSVSIRGGARELRLRRTGEAWNLVAPVGGRASKAKVEEMLRAVESMRAERFVEDGAMELGRYGLEPSWRTVQLEVEGASALTLRIGSACESDHGAESEDTGRRHVLRQGTKTVVCAQSADFFAGLDRDPAELRDRRVLSVRNEDVQEISLEGGGREVRLERSGEGYRLVKPTLAPADSDTVQRMLSDLRSLEATAFVPLGEVPAPGFAQAVRLTVKGTAGNAEVIRVGPRDGDTIFVRRGDEDLALRVPARIAETAAVDALRFRPRRIVNDDVLDATSMSIEAGAMRQRLKKTEGVWKLESPIAFRADSLSTRDVVRRIAELTIERWVSERAETTHGLGSPTLRLTVKFEGEADGHAEPEEGEDAGADGIPPRPTAAVREYTLVVGAQAEGGYFAQLHGPGGGDAVFVVARALVEDATQPLVDRNLVQVDESDARMLTIERQAGRVELRHEGDAWKKGNAELARDRIAPLLDKLASVRAIRAIGYGPPPAQAALLSPAVRLTVTRAEHEEGEPDTLVVSFGATSGTGADAGYYARRSDVDATVLVPTDVVNALLGMF